MRTKGSWVVVCSLAVTVAVLVAISPARASIARNLTLDELVASASNVVVGRCSGVECRRGADGTIETIARVDVADDLKGDAAGVVEVVTLGGEVGGVGMYVPGMPSFVEGRDEVLFLRPTGSGRFEVVGMAQGQFEIKFASAVAPPVVDRRLEGLQLVGRADRRLERGSLSGFLRAVRTTVAQTEQGR